MGGVCGDCVRAQAHDGVEEPPLRALLESLAAVEPGGTTRHAHCTHRTRACTSESLLSDPIAPRTAHRPGAQTAELLEQRLAGMAAPIDLLSFGAGLRGRAPRRPHATRRRVTECFNRDGQGTDSASGSGADRGGIRARSDTAGAGGHGRSSGFASQAVEPTGVFGWYLRRCAAHFDRMTFFQVRHAAATPPPAAATPPPAAATPPPAAATPRRKRRFVQTVSLFDRLQHYKVPEVARRTVWL